MNQQQPQTDQLSLILENITNPSDPIRKQAENEITRFSDENLGLFFIELSKKISTETEKKTVRQVCSAVIKRILEQPKYAEIWFKLSEDIKQTIKNNILSTLASEMIDIRKAAAVALAGICKIEIPMKQYLNIFDILSNTSQNENLYIQLSSLTALEYIYEEIKKSNIPNETVAKLLNTYYSLLTMENADPQLSLATLNSVDKFLPFITDFINDTNSKIKFFCLIEKYIMNSNEKIRHAALLIFYDISTIYYDSLQDYIDKIFNFCNQIIENDIEINKKLCIEIWIIIGVQEEERQNSNNRFKKQSHCFLEKYYLPLSQICLKYIVTDNYEQDEFSLSRACADLLYYMSKVCQYTFMQEMIKYIGQNINSPVEKMKYSALNVFNSIIGTSHKDNFYSIAKDSLGLISDILIKKEYPPHFKFLSSIIIKHITKEFAKELVKDTSYFDKMIELFLNLFEISSNDVIFNIFLSLNNLCKRVEWSEKDETNILSKKIESIAKSVIGISSNIANYNDQFNVPMVGFNLLATLGERSALDVKNKMIEIFKFLVGVHENSLNPQNIQDENIRYRYQEYLSSCLTGFLTAGRAEKITTGNLLQNIIKSFNIRNDLYDDAMTLIGSIALFTKEDFNNAMQLISPYLMKGLRAIDSPSLCKTSILCFSDIINGLVKNNKYLHDFLPLIMNILSNEQIDRKLKPHCFNIISDLYINCPNEAFSFFEDIMKVMGGAIQATRIQFDENSEKETILHFIDLREHILETLNCIFYAVKDYNKTKTFIPYVQPIVEYIYVISNDDYAFSINIQKEGLFLIIDFCACYKSEDIIKIINIDYIKNMINKIENDKNEFNDEATKNGIEWAKSVIGEIL